MKKKFLSIFLAILTGAVLAIPALTLKNTKKTSDTIEIYVLQTGVFKNYENAKEKQSQIKNSVIYKENDSYLVLVGASTNESGLKKIENLLQNTSINYYKKNITILESDVDLFKKYNLMLEKAENEETVLLLNKKILERVAQDEL